MSDEDLILPDTIEETEQAIIDLRGTIGEIREQMQSHLDEKAAGLPVDDTWYYRAKTKVKYLGGDVAALKMHLQMMRANAGIGAKTVERANARDRLANARENMAMVERIQKAAIEAKMNRKIALAQWSVDRENAQRRVFRDFISKHMPERLPEVYALADAEAKRFDAIRPRGSDTDNTGE